MDKESLQPSSVPSVLLYIEKTGVAPECCCVWDQGVLAIKKKPQTKARFFFFVFYFYDHGLEWRKQRKEKMYSFVSIETSFFLPELIFVYYKKKLNAAAEMAAA